MFQTLCWGLEANKLMKRELQNFKALKKMSGTHLMTILNQSTLPA